MSDSPLEQYADKFDTAMGLAFLGKRAVFRGQDLHHDLKDLQWLELFLLGVTGRRFDNKQMRLLNFIWVSTSYPDPRIWCNRVASLAGSARSSAVLALCGANSLTEADIYGVKPAMGGIDFLLRARQQLLQGKELADIIDHEVDQNRIIYGYGRPLIGVDERIPHVLAFARELDLADGPYLQLALEVEKHFIRNKQFGMNIIAIYAGLAADLGFDARQFGLYCTLLFSAGMLPCYLDTLQRPPGTFLPVRCEEIDYQGPPPREW
ncbi:citrate synthase family protein [Bowmanella dokdonensis]|uniref:Uncharacterized protein n=1 Tax=Bowmanella dokdonensis TaxID=751969 RepID=A0A939DLD5_9ALTE|nr:citrate/2-methylcitrate synthase [Bowmanella dokdonensis]MBN7824618.1 hypothetical protein [Bowmanella dokdonensis]